MNLPSKEQRAKDQETDLILRWPDVFDDRAARADWGWEPHYDFDATVEALVQFAKSQS